MKALALPSACPLHKKAEHTNECVFCFFCCPAVTYSPGGLPLEYHRRGKA